MTAEPKIYRAGTLTYTTAALVVLCFWLLWGDFCFYLMETIVPSIMPLKFQAVGAPNTVMGLTITTIPLVINLFCNPVISFKSDRFRSRWGRRIPFILATLPFLVVCLVTLGYSDRIGFWLQKHVAVLTANFSPATVAMFVMGTVMALFSFFNTFVNSVFWYLFNDVVPEQLMARFMSLLRMVSLGAAAVYNLLIFKQTQNHSIEIFIGAAILYSVGFGLMCLNVKEGQYPAPPENVDHAVGPIAEIKTYGEECFSLSHYWYLFLANAGIAIGYATTVFTFFMFQSLGLTREMYGQSAFVSTMSSAIAIPVIGWLADRYHPIRIVMTGALLQVIVLPLYTLFLFSHPSPQTAFHVILVLGACLFGPIASLVSVIDPVLGMRIYPRERYGQFCSANSVCRSLGGIFAGVLVGVYLDEITARWGSNTAYLCLPLWNLAAYLLVLFSIVMLYRSWKRYGGDESYVPPLPADSDPGKSRMLPENQEPEETTNPLSIRIR